MENKVINEINRTKRKTTMDKLSRAKKIVAAIHDLPALEEVDFNRVFLAEAKTISRFQSAYVNSLFEKYCI